MADQRHREGVKLGQELSEVGHILDHGISAAAGPLRIAMSAQVRGDNVVIMTKGPGDPVPSAGMVRPTMDQGQERFVRVAPVYIVELQALGDIVVRSRFEIKLSNHAASFLLNANIWCHRISIVILDSAWF